jgi:MOSC domain-containing protein
MQADPSHSPAAHVEGARVIGLWRYPVKSILGEELNASEVTERGLVGDRQFAVSDPATGKVAGAKNPRKWGNFFDFHAAFVEPPKAGSKLPAVRVTLPDGTVVTSEEPDLAQILSKALGRQVAFAETQHGEASTGATAEEYWPDMAGLDYRDTVTEWELPAGTFFDLAVMHLLTTATIERLRELYPGGRFEVRRFRPNNRRLDRARCAGLRRERLDRPYDRDRGRGPFANHRSLPALRHDHAAAGRPGEGSRHPARGSAAQSDPMGVSSGGC